MSQTKTSRPIRSYVRREGRITLAQRRALEVLLPKYGLEPGAGLLNFQSIFSRKAPTWLEIGFGNGDHLLSQAQQYPENNYIGIEVHRPGIGNLLRRLDADGLDNVRIFSTDAVDVIAHAISENSLQGIYVFFPDPWPKKRHHKRRLLQAPFVASLANRLKPGGKLHIATDWEEYAQQIKKTVNAEPLLQNLTTSDDSGGRSVNRIQTRFECRGQKLGHRVWDLISERR